MKRISLEELLYSRRGQPYGEQHRYVMELIRSEERRVGKECL